MRKSLTFGNRKYLAHVRRVAITVTDPEFITSKTIIAMSCLGVLFSLDEKTARKLKAFSSDEDRLEYLQEEIEEVYYEDRPGWVGELDKSWDALHRSLTDGQLTYEGGSYPMNHVLLGGDILYTSGDYIMSLKTPEQVKQIAANLEGLDKATLRKGYDRIDAASYGSPLTDDDFDYTWDCLRETLPFWKQAAREGRFVLFSVDQ